MNKKIVMYSTTWCPDCRYAKMFLDEYGVSYEEVNIEEHDDAAEKVMNFTGGKRVVPTFDIDGKMYANPRRGELKTILEL